MRYRALATDYDGTIATHGRVDEETCMALHRLKASGRRLLLVTGRELHDLQGVFDDCPLFDILVVENGAVVYEPMTRRTTVLCAPPPPAFLAELERRGLYELSVGCAIVATGDRWARLVVDAIRDLGLDLQVTFNRDAVMVLPPGVNKATGLLAALARLRLSPRDVVAVGDAENDYPLLEVCGLGIAVANAVPALQARADLVTRNERGAGVVEIVERILSSDLDDLAGIRLAR